jgi:putative peptidoglycan lipid II flippase
MPGASSSSSRHAVLVAAGIFLSRIAGLIRQRVFAHYFGSSDAADAFQAAFRIPNFLQNLFGEGVLSASFIPVYARLLAERDEEAAGRVAGACGALLALLTSVLVLLGVLTTPWLVDLVAPGFEGDKRELTIQLVRVLFPGAGLLVTSAWCLGILNSHRRFFLSYAAPVAWNATVIAALVAVGGRVGETDLAMVAAWGSVAGSALQFLVQLPVVLTVSRGLKPLPGAAGGHVRSVLVNFVPVVASRGVVQISAYVDEVLASLLPTGAVAGLVYAQTISMLPVSLFGMSVSAAELPAMSGATGTEEEVGAALRQRLNSGLRRIAVFVVPSAVALLVLGDVLAAALYQSGRFTAMDARYVWAILAGSGIGLLATTLGRLYSSAFFALRDTRTPLKFAMLRVAVSIALACGAALYLPGALGIDSRWGVAGITTASSVAAWLEFGLLRRSLGGRIGTTGLPAPVAVRLAVAAAAGAGLGYAVKLVAAELHPIARASLVIAPFGAVYFAVAAALGIDEPSAILRRLRGMLPGGSR